MKPLVSSRISPPLQIALVYVLAAIWQVIFIKGVADPKDGASWHIIWNILFLFIPPVWIYLMVRFARSERIFVASHPKVFWGAIAVAMLPPFLFMVLVGSTLGR
jgi:hypothetical protein